MYSETRFHSAKAALAYSILHNPDDRIKQVEVAFLRSLLGLAADRGQVTPDDVQRAVESSGACDLDSEIADSIIADLWQVGDSYIGVLSARQTAELRRLRDLCLRVNSDDLDAMMTIADMI